MPARCSTITSGFCCVKQGGTSERRNMITIMPPLSLP
jgi:hypothetical protein